MATVNLNWTYDMTGPLPTMVEVLRNDVVIHTAYSPIVSYIDSSIPASIEEASYKIRAVNGLYQEESDVINVSFDSFDDYEHYYKFDGSVIDLINPIPSISCESPVFGNFGIDPLGSSNISTYVQYDANPEYLLNSSTFTVEIKIKAGQQDSYKSIVELSNSNLGWALRCEYTTGCIYFIIGSQEYDSSIPVFDNEPHKIAVSASNGELRIYIDDVLDKTHILINPPSETYGYTLVGKRLTTNEAFNGEIKDFGISLKSLYD